MSRAWSQKWFSFRSIADRITVLSFFALGLGLLTQLVWMIGTDRNDGIDFIKLVNVTGFTLLALSAGRSKIVVVLMRLVLAFTFLGSVADRFGLLGGPGKTGVSWETSRTLSITRETSHHSCHPHGRPLLP